MRMIKSLAIFFKANSGHALQPAIHIKMLKRIQVIVYRVNLRAVTMHFRALDH